MSHLNQNRKDRSNRVVMMIDGKDAAIPEAGISTKQIHIILKGNDRKDVQTMEDGLTNIVVMLNDSSLPLSWQSHHLISSTISAHRNEKLTNLTLSNFSIDTSFLESVTIILKYFRSIDTVNFCDLKDSTQNNGDERHELHTEKLKCLARAINSNPKIQSLSLQRVPDWMVVQVLHDLRINSNLTHLKLKPDMRTLSLQISVLVGALLKSQKFCLQHLAVNKTDFTGMAFRAIYEGLLESTTSICKLSFEYCKFDNESAEMLIEIFNQTSKFNRGSLFLGDNNVFCHNEANRIRFRNNFFFANKLLQRADALSLHHIIIHSWSLTDCERMLESLAINNTLQCLTIKCHTMTNKIANALIATMPRFNSLKEINLDVPPLSSRDKIKILQAFRDNTSLERATIGFGNEKCSTPQPIFGEDDANELKCYLTRNKDIHIFTSTPYTLRSVIWPFIMDQMRKQGESRRLHYNFKALKSHP